MIIKYTCVIVDDEQDSREIITSFLKSNFPDLEILATASNVQSAIENVDKYKPDIIFLDIQLLNGSGFDVLSKIAYKKSKIIFITAFDNFALRAINYSASDYILKPLEMQEFCEAVEKSLNELKLSFNSDGQLQFLLQNIIEKKSYSTIALPTLNSLEFVSLSNILYLEAKNNYTIFHILNKEKITVSKTLKEYEDVLNFQHFFRIHNSYIINLNFIKKYTKGRGGHVTLINGEEINVSENRRVDFLNKMG